jgi:hypothetical protein
MVSFKFRIGIQLLCRRTGKTTRLFTSSSVAGGYTNRLLPIKKHVAKVFHCHICLIRRGASGSRFTPQIEISKRHHIRSYRVRSREFYESNAPLLTLRIPSFS